MTTQSALMPWGPARLSARAVSAFSWLALIALVTAIALTSGGGDAHAYWAAEGYGRLADTKDAFLYTPPFLLALRPFQLLPWEAFRLLWLAGQVAALAWLLGPMVAALVILPGSWSPVYVDLWYGNVMIFTAALCVAGFRSGAWWAILPFAKVLPGVALLAGGWRPIAAVVVIATASMVAAPGLWGDWVDAMAAAAAAPPENGLADALIPRVVIAVGLIGLGRLRHWRWSVPLAVMIAQPVLWFSSLTILFALVPLVRDRVRESAAEARVDGRDREPLSPRPLVAIPVVAAAEPQAIETSERSAAAR